MVALPVKIHAVRQYRERCDESDVVGAWVTESGDRTVSLSQIGLACYMQRGHTCHDEEGVEDHGCERVIDEEQSTLSSPLQVQGFVYCEC